MPTVLVLGATSDIGFAIARRFAKEGYNVQLASRNPGQLSSFQSDLQIRYNINCTTHRFDASAYSSHRDFYNNLSPKPDVTIYVIGYMTENEKAITDWNESVKTIDANYTGAVSILNIIAQDYAQRKSGTIAGVSSVAGLRGRQCNYIYGSAKAAFTTYLSGLRNRMHYFGVHVVTVLPGFVYTKMTEHLSLPKLLTANTEEVGDAVYNAVKAKKDVIYVKWYWRWIMLIIRSIPEGIFKKKRL